MSMVDYGYTTKAELLNLGLGREQFWKRCAVEFCLLYQIMFPIDYQTSMTGMLLLCTSQHCMHMLWVLAIRLLATQPSKAGLLPDCMPSQVLESAPLCLLATYPMRAGCEWGVPWPDGWLGHQVSLVVKPLAVPLLLWPCCINCPWSRLVKRPLWWPLICRDILLSLVPYVVTFAFRDVGLRGGLAFALVWSWFIFLWRLIFSDSRSKTVSCHAPPPLRAVVCYTFHWVATPPPHGFSWVPSIGAATPHATCTAGPLLSIDKNFQISSGNSSWPSNLWIVFYLPFFLLYDAIMNYPTSIPASTWPRLAAWSLRCRISFACTCACLYTNLQHMLGLCFGSVKQSKRRGVCTSLLSVPGLRMAPSAQMHSSSCTLAICRSGLCLTSLGSSPFQFC